MTGLCLLNRRLTALLRRGLGSTFFFSGRPEAYAAVVDALDRLAEAARRDELPLHLDRDILLEDLASGERRRVRLCQPPRLHPREDVISVFSPLGAALLEAQPGQRVEVRLLGRRFRFRVIAVGDRPVSESSSRGKRRTVVAALRTGSADHGAASFPMA